jgi:hypothetical protein
MSRYAVVAAPQPARIVLSPFEKNWNLSIDAETRPGRPRSARGHLASRSHASGRALSRALVRSVKLSPTLQRPARMSSFGANSVDASERLAARRSMERRLSGFHNGAAPAHTEGLRVSAVRWRHARPVRSATGPPTDAGKLARRPWEDYPVCHFAPVADQEHPLPICGTP